MGFSIFMPNTGRLSMKLNNHIRHIFKKRSILQEMFILFLLILLLTQYYEPRKVVIVADGKGYYDYLPAAFIYHDLNFSYTDTLITEFYDHRAYNQGLNPRVNGRRINKYFIGTAVAQVPFFLTAHGIAVAGIKYSADGYSFIYQQFVKLAALFYLFLGLVFLRKLLQQKGIPGGWILLLQGLVVFGSSLMQYAYADASFSHVYSFFFITFFVYCISRYAKKENNNFLYLAALAFGMIVLIRPANGLILAFVPFLFDDAGHFAGAVRGLFTIRLKPAFIALALALLVIAIQPLVWYLQTGLLYIKPYQDETFILSQAHMLKFLFSYQKGFFVYAPVFFLMLLGGTWVYLKQHHFWKTGSFYLALAVLVYVLSSWHNWSYGASFGSRVMVDYYSLFVLFASSVFLSNPPALRWLFLILFLPLSYISIIQTLQYQTYFLDDASMSREKYWTVFLKTHPKYRGLFYMHKVKLLEEQILIKKNISQKVKPETFQMGYNLLDSLDGSQLKPLWGEAETLVLQVLADVCYKKGIDEILVAIDDLQGNNRYWSSMHLFKVAGKERFCGRGRLQFRMNANLLEDATIRLFYIKQEKDTEFKEMTVQLAGVD
ncbi:MAG: hypothetical protein V2I46_09505 [Bacteroides sp.]|jgi:hypothetical protein|nr:hypothetical protein [Bacteroides sp.]